MQFIKIIPADPGLVPDPDREEAVVGLLQDLLPDAGDIDCVSYARLHFASPEDALRTVACARCGSALAIGMDGEHVDWWMGCLEGQYTGAGDTLSRPTPCCGATLRLDQLEFTPRAGFSRFEVCVNDPCGQLGEEDLASISDAFGCDAMLVSGHFGD